MRKDYKDINEMLQRFLQGTSTLEEEHALGEFFRTHQDIPKEWKAYQMMFAYFDAGMKDTESSYQPQSKEQSNVTDKTPIKTMRLKHHQIYKLLAAACIFGILAGGMVWFIQRQNRLPLAPSTETALNNNLSMDSDRLLPSSSQPNTANNKVKEDYKMATQSSVGNKTTNKSTTRRHAKATHKSPKNTSDKNLSKAQQAEIEIMKSMKEVNNSRLEAMEAIQQARQQVMDAKMKANGYTPVMDEAGNTTYINTNNIKPIEI